MLKNIGNPLSKNQQKKINGGFFNNFICYRDRDCLNIPEAQPVFPGDFSCVRQGHYGYCVPN